MGARLAGLLAAVLVVWVRPCLGQAPLASEWQLVASSESIAESNPSGSDNLKFWDNLQNGAFDQFCKAIKIPISQSVKAGDVSRAKLKLKRYLHRLPPGISPWSTRSNPTSGWALPIMARI